MKKKSNWIVGLLGTVLLFSAGYRIEPRLLWLLESALLGDWSVPYERSSG
jgi:hypothetical protein